MENDKPMDIKEEITEPKKEEENSQEQEELSSINKRKDAEDKRKKNINLAYWTMIAFVIITCCFVIYYISSNASQCLSNPIKYYAEKIGTQCYCMSP